MSAVRRRLEASDSATMSAGAGARARANRVAECIEVVMAEKKVQKREARKPKKAAAPKAPSTKS